jgi:hypothetical protein
MYGELASADDMMAIYRRAVEILKVEGGRIALRRE